VVWALALICVNTFVSEFVKSSLGGCDWFGSNGFTAMFYAMLNL